MSTHYCVTEHWAGDWFHFRGHDCRCTHWTIDVAWARCLKADWDKWHKCHRDGPPTPSSDSKVTILVWKGLGWLNTFIPSSVLQTPLSEELWFWFPSLLHLHLTSVHNSTGLEKWSSDLVTFLPAVSYHSCLNLLEQLSQPGAHFLSQLCTNPWFINLRNRHGSYSQPDRQIESQWPFSECLAIMECYPGWRTHWIVHCCICSPESRQFDLIVCSFFNPPQCETWQIHEILRFKS